MPSGEVLDFDQMLGPIPGDAPAGRNLREPGPGSGVFDELLLAQTNARRADRKMLVSGQVPRLPNEDWGRVLTLGQSILTTQSKDLQVAAWLIETLLRFQGFAGLRDGFRLARELAERYWDDLSPAAEDGRFGTRLAHFWGLNGVEGSEGTLLFPIRLVALTNGEPPVTLFDYTESSGSDEVRAAIRAAPEEHLRNVRADVGLAAEELERLHATLRERGGEDAPPIGNIRDALSHATEIVRGATSHLPDDDAAGDAGGEGAEAAGGVTGDGAIRNRSQALDTIDRLAKYFRETDEHSFVSFHLERAARWGRTPLPKLLEELIKDESEREKVFEYIGIPFRPPDAESGG